MLCKMFVLIISLVTLFQSHHEVIGQLNLPSSSSSYRNNYNQRKDVYQHNSSPVIGILSLPEEDSGYRSSPSNFPSSYVKFIESAGGRVYPVLIGRDEQYYRNIINLTNGILLTGGSVDLTNSIYTSSAYTIWRLAIQLNQAGDYFPLWGICQGFEFFIYAANGLSKWPLTNCSAENSVQPLTFLLNHNQLRRTKMFQHAPDYILELLANDLVTYNAHSWCLPVNLTDSFGSNVFFNSLSKCVDSNGLEYVSMIESFDYPFYGVQFHPEKPAFEPVITPDRSNTPHSFESILVGQYFANFFVNETRKNGHPYPDQLERYRAQLIYNYCPKYTGINASEPNQEIYYFD